MKVIKLVLSRLHNEEWFGVYVDFKEEVTKFGAEQLGIQKLFQRLLPLHYKADKLLLVLRKSVLTDELAAIDKERDTYFGALLRSAKDKMSLPAADKQEAAKRVYNLLSHYRQNGILGGYAEESSAIYNLLQDLKGKYKADITLLALGEWVDALRLAENKFVDLRKQRIDETDEKPKESLPEIRSEMDLLYNSMTDVLDAQLVADGLGGDLVVEPGSLDNGIWEDGDPTPPYLRGNVVYNFVTRWNVILQGYHNLLAARAGRAAKKDQPEEPSDPQPEEPSDPQPEEPSDE
jgi:hypothetical protein